MSIRASDLYQLPPEALKALDEAEYQIKLIKVELARVKAAGHDTAEQDDRLAAMEKQVALYREHFGHGSAARWARQARGGG